MLEFQTKQNLGGANDSRAATKAGALEQNSRNDELKTAVTATGQTLTPNSTQVDTNTAQLAKAMWINGVSGGQMQDNGSANVVQLTPITGSTGLRVPSAADGGYDVMDGARVVFMPAYANTGNTTLNIGQTGATLIGAKKMLLEDGSEIPSGTLSADASIEVKYDSSADSSNGAWIVLPWSSQSGFARLDTLQTWTKPQSMFEYTIPYASSLAWDFSLYQTARVTLIGDATLANPSNIPAGVRGQYSLIVVQDGTGGWALSYGAAFLPAATGRELPAIATDPGATTLINFETDGTYVYAGGGA